MKPRITVTLLFTLACAAGQAVIIHGQSLNDVRRLFDSGQYQQVIAAAAEDPRVTYLRAQSYEKLSQSNEARQVYAQLAARPESDAWQAVGRSALALASSDAAGALEASNQAVARDGTLPEAYYQQGMAFSANQDFRSAAVAFQKAADLDPNWAYAHYNAGIAYSKVKRADLTAQHFQTFLRLAPQAPERGQVQSILRTLNR